VSGVDERVRESISEHASTRVGIGYLTPTSSISKVYAYDVHSGGVQQVASLLVGFF
jgi:hypothetical protein